MDRDFTGGFRFTSLSMILVAVLVFAGPTTGSAEQAVHWVFTDYPPANYVGESGKPAGFFCDMVMEALEKRMGQTVVFSVFPWKRCQAMVRDGQADMMVTIPTPERLAYAVTHAHPLWIKKRILYTYRGHTDQPRLDALKGLAAIRAAGYTVVSYLGNGWVKSAVEKSGIDVQYANSVESMYRMLASRRADLIIEEETLAAPRIQALGLKDKIVPTLGVGSQSGFHILIGKRSPCTAFMPRLEAVLEDMAADGTLARILDRYGVHSGAPTRAVVDAAPADPSRSEPRQGTP